MTITIFNAVFIIALFLLLSIPIFRKLKDYKTTEEWEEIKKNNSKQTETMETTSKQDPDKQI